MVFVAGMEVIVQSLLKSYGIVGVVNLFPQTFNILLFWNRKLVGYGLQ